MRTVRRRRLRRIGIGNMDRKSKFQDAIEDQEVKRFKKAVSKTWGLKQILNYLK